MTHGGTVGAIAVAVATTLVAAAWVDGYRSGGQTSDLSLLTAFVGVCLAGLLVLRRQHPVIMTLAGSVAAIALPMDSFVALLSMTWVIATARVRTAVLCSVAATTATVVALARDYSREPDDRVFSMHDQVTGALTHTPGPYAFWLAGVALIGAAIGVGLARRFRNVADRSGKERDSAVTALAESAVRQDERELIAREVHDTVAHHIATIAMQASAFEVTQQDPSAKDAARQVRSSAQQAIAELRALLTALRTGEHTGVEGATLEDLVPLLDRLREGGLAVTGTVFVANAEDASETLARATFRIVQESLTNALKHAPGSAVEMSVRAGRSHGVEVRVTNPINETARPGAGTQSGIIGMGERTAALGGTFHAGVEDGRFVVTAHLPWSERTASR